MVNFFGFVFLGGGDVGQAKLGQIRLFRQSLPMALKSSRGRLELFELDFGQRAIEQGGVILGLNLQDLARVEMAAA
jgi:hypothetical protein